MKRKRSFESDNKKITEMKHLNPKNIPGDIWNYIGEFLNGNNIINMGLVSQFYVGIAKRWMINSYKKELNQYGYQFQLDSKETPSLESLKNYRDLVPIKKNKYYTLVDRSYAKLFDLIESKDFESAKRFIGHKILNQATVPKQKNITDMVFFQKNSLGQSVIMIARDFGQQDFLDFCFKNLILNGPDLNQGKYSLVKTEDLDTVLSKLASGADMSVEALWMFACVYVCKQKIIYDEFSKRNWKEETLTATIDGSNTISLLMIATLLGCIDLAKYVMSDDISDEEFEVQINCILRLDYEKGPILYYNTEVGLSLQLLDVAAMSKNIKFIDYLFSELEVQFNSNMELVAFYLEQKNLTELDSFTKYMPDYQLNHPIVLTAPYFNVKIPHNSGCLSLLGIAVAQNWPEAVNLLVNRGALLNGQFEPNYDLTTVPVPLNIAINLGYYDMAVSLLQLGANPDSIDNYRYSDIPDPVIANYKQAPGAFCSELTEPSALTCAIHQGNLNFIQLLLQHGVSLRRETRNKSENFTFPLIIAIYSNNLAIVDAIIKIIGVEEALNQLLSEHKKKQEKSPNFSKWHDPISRNKHKMWKLKNASDNLLQEFPCFQSKYTLK